MDITIIRRTDEIVALKKLLPLCRNGSRALYDLVRGFSSEEWKELLVHYWQQQERRVVEIEERIRELGGTCEPEDVLEPEPRFQGLASMDKELILYAIHQQTAIAHAYSETQKFQLSFNVRMMLQRHQLQIQDMLERLSPLCQVHVPHGISFKQREDTSYIHRV